MPSPFRQGSRFLFLAALALSLVLSPAPPPRIWVALLGDVMLGRGVAEAHQAGDWEQVFTSLSGPLNGADLVIANLESPITTAPLIRPAYDLRAPQAAVQALTVSGIDLLTLANNHSRDAGAAGLQDTRSSLSSAGLQTLAGDGEVFTYHAGDGTVSVVAFDDVERPLDSNWAAQVIQAARHEADWVIVSIHWGEEYQPGPSLRQKRLADQLVAAGANLIFGHHPHVLQSTAWMDDPLTGQRSFVAYSLGNALFDQPSPPPTRLSALLLVELGTHGVEQVVARPFAIGWRSGQVVPANTADAQAAFKRLGIPFSSP